MELRLQELLNFACFSNHKYLFKDPITIFPILPFNMKISCVEIYLIFTFRNR